MNPPPPQMSVIPEKTRSRGYQMEMLNQSLKRNIIVTMDTGSGKTHIAVLRIRSYLETGEGKLCWLLVPSVPLGNQQFDVLKSALPPVNIQFLSGSDNVDKWKTQKIWDGVLKLREKTPTVVVSTHQILLDALTHGFVGIDMIGLLIFDEAHHCVANHPANRIMKDFYHPNINHRVPSILGLTASPIVKSDPDQLKVIESNMNSISRTPILNREELMQYVHTPVLKKVTYGSAPSIGQVMNMKVERRTSSGDSLGGKRGASPGMDTVGSPALAKLKVSETEYVHGKTPQQASMWATPVLRSLMHAYTSMDIMDDPRVINLLATEPPDLVKIQKTIQQKKTRSFHQMNGIVKKAEHVLAEYGIWGTEWYITMIVKRALEAMEEDSQSTVLDGWDEQEKIYFVGVLKGVTMATDFGDVKLGITDKVEQLIQLLVDEFHGENGGSEFSGLVFVEQRVGVTVLAQILREHPDTKDIFNVGTLVGTADNSAKTGRLVFELTTLREQKGTIYRFRQKTKNLVISTSVVEEGLDIPACHLVVCFALPKNVKSFIQRRGRARREKSTYYLMFEEGSNTREKIGMLEELEREMIKEYMDETRELERRLDLEENEPDDDGVISDAENRRFLVKNTNALLTLGSALPHLHHFCDTLPYTEHADLRPIFTAEGVSSGWGFIQMHKVKYRAEVLLPNSVPQSVRRATSKQTWATKRWAIRDAAFEAYLALYKLEDPLINDHLLPLIPVCKDPIVASDAGPPTATVERMIDPWDGVSWTDITTVYVTPITLRMPDEEPISMHLYTTMKCPHIDNITVYWTKTNVGEITVGDSYSTEADDRTIERAKKVTYELLHSVHAAKMEGRVMDFAYLFFWSDGVPVWEDGNESNNAYDARIGDIPLQDLTIIREAGQDHTRYVFSRWRHDISPSSDTEILKKYHGRSINPDQPVIEAHRLSHRRNFLQKPSNEAAPETVLLLPQYCTIDNIPWRYSQFALFIPGLIHRVGMSLVALDARNTLLESVGFKSSSKILTALSTPSSREPQDYQRLEFLGDSILKFLVSVHLLDEHPSWHEGMLSARKATVVSNAALARAAQSKGLARWIISDEFAGGRWSPSYTVAGCDNHGAEESSESQVSERVLSTKMLADVVEALIGAAYHEGGYEQALKCMESLGLDMTWKPLAERSISLFDRAKTAPQVNIPYLIGLQDVLGYKFKNQSILLEAITHPSSEISSPSYQRLEFLGDALIDMVVVDELYFDSKNLSPADMHLYKCSVVNGNLLAFVSTNCSATEEVPTVEEIEHEFHVKTKQQRTRIWDYIHLSHPEMIKAKRRFLDHIDDSQSYIQQHLDTAEDYPWAELAPLEADLTGKCKLFADMIEAIVGAVYIDAAGDFAVVKALVERLGILGVLRRFVKDEVNVMHPFNRVSEAAGRLGRGSVLYLDSVEDGLHVHTAWVQGRILATAKSSCKVQSKMLAAQKAFEILEREEEEQKEKLKAGSAEENSDGCDVDMDVQSSFRYDAEDYEVYPL